MKRFLLCMGLGLFTTTLYADNISDGLSMAGDATYSYLPYVQALGYILACIIGIVAAFEIYYAIVNNSPYIQKKIIKWGGSCLTMFSMTIVLPQFFTYQEGGLVGGSGSYIPSNGNNAGSDSYGVLDISIPAITDSRWTTDGKYLTINVGGKETNVNTFLNTLYDQMGAGQRGSYGNTLNYISNALASGAIDQATYNKLMSYVGNLPHC